MAKTDFDVIINGTKAKVIRSEQGGYRKRSVRREIEQNLLTQAQEPVFSSRFDRISLYQKSWAGGSRWWQPLLAGGDIDSYFRSNHMDVWSEPGRVIPLNKVVDESAADEILTWRACLVTAGTDLWAVGNTQLNAGTGFDMYKWVPGSDDFIRQTAVTSGTTNPTRAIAYDPTTDFFFNLHSAGVTKFQPDGTTDSAVTGATVAAGANIFVTRGEVLVYTGKQVLKINSAGTGFDVIADDGLPVDFLESYPNTETGLAGKGRFRLATLTPEGVFYVKNVRVDGQPVPYVFRVDRNDAGTWIVAPIATLPVGTLALDITHHLGSVIISTTPDWRGLAENSTSDHVEVVLYFVDFQSGMGALGSVLGNTNIDETPYALLGSEGPLLFLGGHKRLWVYDGIRGGIHPVHEWGTASTKGPYFAMSSVTNSDGDQVHIFAAPGRIAKRLNSRHVDPDIVTAFGDDETHHALESNYFDGGLPMESKELTKVAILRQAATGGNQEWTIQISADDGSFTDRLVHSTTGETYAEADLSGVTGRKFRYKAIYQTKDAVRKALEAILVTFAGGEMVTEWELYLDGDEILNVDNEVQDEQVFYDALQVVASTQTQIDFVDNMQEQEQVTPIASSVKVKVLAVETIKEKPGESLIRVILREA